LSYLVCLLARVANETDTGLPLIRLLYGHPDLLSRCLRDIHDNHVTRSTAIAEWLEHDDVQFRNAVLGGPFWIGSSSPLGGGGHFPVSFFAAVRLVLYLLINTVNSQLIGYDKTYLAKCDIACDIVRHWSESRRNACATLSRDVAAICDICDISL
jgi:hypothetical protein